MSRSTPDAPRASGAHEPAVAAAAATAERLDALGAAERAALLDAVAAALEGDRDRIVAQAAHETALGEERLTGELARTCLQLRAYGAAAASGAAAPAAALAGEDPRLVRDSIAIGPVAIVEAGNFPLAFGALGTDTAAALAAGCPVVVKAHPGHPETSELCVAAAAPVLASAGLAGALSLVHGGPEAAVALATDPRVAAVAFTGSRVAGRALMDAAAARPAPIPVYAEMGSVNPVVVTAAAAERRGAAIGAQLAGSALGSAGQLCTKPGLLLIPVGAAGDALVAALAAAFAAGGPYELLNAPTADRLDARLGELRALDALRTLVARDGAGAALFELAAEDATEAAAAALDDEAFGPAAVVVRHRGPEHALRLLGALGGQLTTTVMAEPEDVASLAQLLRVARRIAGRIVWNDVPTGVAVAPAMHHGGPWPAASSLLGSVGPEALLRFRRPLTWQGVPDAARQLATGALTPPHVP